MSNTVCVVAIFSIIIRKKWSAFVWSNFDDQFR